MPKRSWAMITGLSDLRTRVAVSLVTDPEILACFARGFPHLFIEGDDEGPLRMPLSALMEAAAEYCRQELGGDDEEKIRNFTLVFAGERYPHLRIPIAFDWGDCDPDPPQAVLDQLVGQKAQAGLVVEYEGRRYVVLTIDFVNPPKIGSTITEVPQVISISLVDAEFVALDK